MWMKYPSIFLGKSNLTSREIFEVVMQTSESASTIRDTEIIVKIPDSTYAKAYLEQFVSSAFQMSSE